MPYIIEIVCLADGQRHPYDGSYVVTYDPSVGSQPGECLLDVTRDPACARAFPTAMEAVAYTRQVDQRQPVRPDGRPNRPLTAFTLSIEPLRERSPVQ